MSTLRSTLNVIELHRLRKWVRKVGVFILLLAHKATILFCSLQLIQPKALKKREIITFIAN